MCQAKNIQALREDLCDASSAFSGSLKTSLFSLEDKFQIFKILPKSFDNIQKVDTVYGKVYKRSTLANQNQPDKTTDIVIDTNKTMSRVWFTKADMWLFPCVIHWWNRDIPMCHPSSVKNTKN